MPGPRILAQLTGALDVPLVDAYTSPADGGGTVVSSLVFANTSNNGGTVEVRLAPGGAANAFAQVLVPVLVVPASGHVALTEGITLGPGDVLRVAAGAQVNVHVFGTEL